MKMRYVLLILILLVSTGICQAELSENKEDIILSAIIFPSVERFQFGFNAKTFKPPAPSIEKARENMANEPDNIEYIFQMAEALYQNNDDSEHKKYYQQTRDLLSQKERLTDQEMAWLATCLWRVEGIEIGLDYALGNYSQNNLYLSRFLAQALVVYSMKEALGVDTDNPIAVFMKQLGKYAQGEDDFFQTINKWVDKATYYGDKAINHPQATAEDYVVRFTIQWMKAILEMAKKQDTASDRQMSNMLREMLKSPYLEKAAKMKQGNPKVIATMAKVKIIDILNFQFDGFLTHSQKRELRKLREKLIELDQGLEQTPGEVYDALTTICFFLENGEAFDWARKAVKVDPSQPNSFILIIKSYAKDKQMERMIELCQQRIEIDNAAVAWNIKAIAEINLGQFQAALNSAQKAVWADKPQPQSEIMLGIAHMVNGNYRQANDQFNSNQLPEDFDKLANYHKALCHCLMGESLVALNIFNQLDVFPSKGKSYSSQLNQNVEILIESIKDGQL